MYNNSSISNTVQVPSRQTLRAPDSNLAHRVLPHVCACGCWLTGFTQTINGHDTVYAHCTNAACPDYYNTQELSFYVEVFTLIGSAPI